MSQSEILGKSRIWSDLIKGNLPANLDNMFANSATIGLSMSADIQEGWESDLENLCVYLGILSEREETGEVIKHLDPEILVERVENILGIEVTFPRVLGAVGAEIGGRLIPRVSWRHLYAAIRLNELSRGPFLEVGGGFGGVCYWLLKLNPQADYTIYDLPEICQISRRFLHTEVGLKVQIKPFWEIKDSQNVDVAYNEDSLNEMDVEAALAYCSLIPKKANKFLSINRTTANAFSLHTLEPYMQEYSRKYHSRYWMRKGYFETLYEKR